jgi:large subunit ribosomal protein L14e
LKKEDKIRMVFTRFVEIGRVCLITYGELEGKLCVILDVIDQNKALVDGPEIPRQKINFRRISLTDIKMDIKRSIKTGKLDAAWKEQDVDAKWAKTSWAKKRVVKTKRANLTDFQRFKAMVLRKKVRLFVFCVCSCFMKFLNSLFDPSRRERERVSFPNESRP